MSKDDLKLYEVNGIQLYVRPNTSDTKSIDEVIGRKGYQRTRPFPFHPETGEVWLDLGANIGAFSVWALKNGAARVLAYEPDPESAEITRLNLSNSGAIGNQYEVHNVAVTADRREYAILYQNTAKGNVWRNSIERSWRGGQQVKVPCRHVKDLVMGWAGDICIKMDIEGTEMPILEWLVSEEGKFYIPKIKKLVFEWSFDVDPDLVRFRHLMGQLVELFPYVAPRNLYEEKDVWPAEWFPPCKTIFCCRL